MRSTFLLGIALLLLAACAGPLRWEKSGAAATDEDTKQCTQEARLKATAVAAPPPPSMPGAIGVPTRQEQYAMSEMHEFQRCMLAKGYTEKR